MSEMVSATAERILGRYALYQEIAVGGMAAVHFGRLLGPVGFTRSVAIKRLHPQFARDPEFVSMFLDEARLAARIRHPNVVPTVDVVATDGELFLVMEYVLGESFAQLLNAYRGRRIPLPIVGSILSGTLHGLHAAHEAKSERGTPLNLVHRAVSPQNILVGVDGIARVLDFGIAKAAGRVQTTHEGQVKGKVAYMAPEQLHQTEITRHADIYAAAVVLWEALTGKRLFEGDNPVQVMAQVLGMAPDPNQRYESARAFAIAIEKKLGMAVPRVVGEWVEKTARPALERRIRTLALIEGALQEASPASAPASERTGHEAATLPRVSVEALRTDAVSVVADSKPPPHPATPDRRVPRFTTRRTLAWIGGALIALVLVAILAVAPSIAASSSPAARPWTRVQHAPGPARARVVSASPKQPEPVSEDDDPPRPVAAPVNPPPNCANPRRWDSQRKVWVWKQECR